MAVLIFILLKRRPLLSFFTSHSLFQAIVFVACSSLRERQRRRQKRHRSAIDARQKRRSEKARQVFGAAVTVPQINKNVADLLTRPSNYRKILIFFRVHIEEVLTENKYQFFCSPQQVVTLKLLHSNSRKTAPLSKDICLRNMFQVQSQPVDRLSIQIGQRGNGKERRERGVGKDKEEGREKEAALDYFHFYHPLPQQPFPATVSVQANSSSAFASEACS